MAMLVAYFAFGEYDRIIAAYEKALSKISFDRVLDRAQIHFDFASFYQDIGREEDAQKHFEEAEKLDPSISSKNKK